MSGSEILLTIPAIVGAFGDRGDGLYGARRRMGTTGDKGRRGGSSDSREIICLRAQSSQSAQRSSGPHTLPSHFSLKQPSVPLLSLLSMLCTHQREFLGRNQGSLLHGYKVRTVSNSASKDKELAVRVAQVLCSKAMPLWYLMRSLALTFDRQSIRCLTILTACNQFLRITASRTT